jgi:hypothetical protein
MWKSPTKGEIIMLDAVNINKKAKRKSKTWKERNQWKYRMKIKHSINAGRTSILWSSFKMFELEQILKHLRDETTQEPSLHMVSLIFSTV